MEDKNTVSKTFGSRLKERRLEMGLSANELADLIEIDRSTIYRYEQGINKNIRLASIEAIARTLRVNPNWLVGKSNEKEIDTTYEEEPEPINITVEEIYNYVKYQLYYNEGVTLNGRTITTDTAKTILQALRVGIEMAKEDLEDSTN